MIRPRAKAASVVLMFGLVGYSVRVFRASSSYPYLQPLLILIQPGVALFVLQPLASPLQPASRSHRRFGSMIRKL